MAIIFLLIIILMYYNLKKNVIPIIWKLILLLILPLLTREILSFLQTSQNHALRHNGFSGLLKAGYLLLQRRLIRLFNIIRQELTLCHFIAIMVMYTAMKSSRIISRFYLKPDWQSLQKMNCLLLNMD